MFEIVFESTMPINNFGSIGCYGYAASNVAAATYKCTEQTHKSIPNCVFLKQRIDLPVHVFVDSDVFNWKRRHIIINHRFSPILHFCTLMVVEAIMKNAIYCDTTHLIHRLNLPSQLKATTLPNRQLLDGSCEFCAINQDFVERCKTVIVSCG